MVIGHNNYMLEVSGGGDTYVVTEDGKRLVGPYRRHKALLMCAALQVEQLPTEEQDVWLALSDMSYRADEPREWMSIMVGTTKEIAKCQQILST